MPHLTRRPPRSAPSAPRRRAVALVLALTAAGGAGAVPARAADPPSWAIRPADGSYGSGRQQLAPTVGAGGRVQDAVELVNPGPSALDLRLAAADAALTSSGQLTAAPGRARPDGVSGWLRLGRSAVTVPARGSVTVPVAIAPPRDAAPGDHVGGIVTALDGPGAGEGPVLPVDVRISGPLKPALAVTDVHTDYEGTAAPLGAGTATVRYVVRNTGNVVLTARQAVRLSGPFGSWERRAAAVADSPPLPPGARWSVTAPVDDVAPAARLAATVELTPLLADAAGSIAPQATTRTTGHAWAVPWTLLAAVLVVLAAVVLALRALRRTAAPRRRAGEAAA